jgi:ribosomal protein L35
MKTTKLIKKRLQVKKNKAYRKKSYQSHYNANDRGEERRNKRNFEKLTKNETKRILPFVG